MDKMKKRGKTNVVGIESQNLMGGKGLRKREGPFKSFRVVRRREGGDSRVRTRIRGEGKSESNKQQRGGRKGNKKILLEVRGRVRMKRLGLNDRA